MADFDVVVIGGGTGNNVAGAAADAGLETALVEPGPLGGTCLNRGCNPSKMLIQAANAANGVRNAEKFHKEYVEFVDDRTIAVDGTEITGEKVVVAAGSRPIVPPIDGLEDVDYLTSRAALYRRELPDSLVILGGGYIAVELGYYFESMGTDVTIVEMLETLVPREDDEVAAVFTEVAAERHDVYTSHRVVAVEETETGHLVRAEDDGGDTLALEGEEVLVALGRRPNTDRLNLESTSIETDENRFVKTDEYLETTAERVWAQGDIADNAMFKHSGDYETQHTIANVVEGKRRAIDLSALPHAIFTEPQIAGVGATEGELAEAGTEYAVGRADFPDSSMGRAKKLERGFLKVLSGPSGEILGVHAFGYEASTLIHEAVLAMRHDLTVGDVADTIHVHPTLSKIVESAFVDAAR